VCKAIGVTIGQATVTTFNDGEINMQIKENIRNATVYIVQSTCPPEVDDNLMELFLLIRTLKRASALSVTAVVPYFGYARQDRKCKPRVPISASDVAILLEAAGVDRVVSVDLHCAQIQGFFQRCPVDNLFSAVSTVPYFARKNLDDVTIVSPDAGGVTRAKEFLEHLQKHSKSGRFRLAMIVKQRGGAGMVEKMDIVGVDVIANTDCVIVDDIVDTAGTLVKAAEELKKAGARGVYAVITHGLLSGPALERIEKSDLTELIITDTVPLPKNKKIPKQIVQISVAKLVGETIRRIHHGESVSGLFDPTET